MNLIRLDFSMIKDVFRHDKELKVAKTNEHFILKNAAVQVPACRSFAGSDSSRTA